MYPEDSSKPDTPENLVRLNVFKTGPKYTRYWNQRNFTQLAAYFIDVVWGAKSTVSGLCVSPPKTILCKPLSVGITGRSRISAN